MKKSTRLFISTSIMMNSILAIASTNEQVIENNVCMGSEKLSEIVDNAIQRDRNILDLISSNGQSNYADCGTEVNNLAHIDCYHACYSNCHANCHSNCNCATGVRG